VTPSQITQKSGQVKTFLLCARCESRFATRGEKWTLENYPQINGVFPIQRALFAAKPFRQQGEDKYFQGESVQGMDLQKLAYFAVSVFWRAGVFQWTLLEQAHRLSLGPYEEALRLYLLDEAPFPERAALHVLVSPAQNHRDGILFPSTYRAQPYHCHGFSIPGILFAISLGHVSRAEREECAISNDVLIMTEKADDLVSKANVKLLNGRPLPGSTTLTPPALRV
jgi:hypothetical protein